MYDQKEIARLAGISENQIRYWEKIGLVPCIKREKRKLFFDFKALVAFKTIKALQQRGVSLKKIKRALEQLKNIMPNVKYPLTETKISIKGKRIIFDARGLKFEPSGQLLLNFINQKGAVISLKKDKVEDLFFKALQYEENGDYKSAKACYLKVLSLDSEHVDALVNLGNIQYHLGMFNEAENLYRKALSLNPDHPEANYNLANLLEEKEDIENAILFYKKAIHEDPEFKDAYFNLARLLEKKQVFKEAKKYWEFYLKLDSESEWANYARKRLEHLSHFDET
ncbi:MAG TPA: tetratricopeptide repeat protein [Candidatus Desulfofervidus auxilii]|uniref:Tetratricopeptide repeat protein n=1 Tax=Desulfofervidus auxilii TaxID=1621989 RepID=A0A7V0NF26_DESA2|nr:tetratricopeptide repeat protein [Candidatus Desulfofervidus auxilii]